MTAASDLAIEVHDLVKRYPRTKRWREMLGWGRSDAPPLVEALRGLSLQVERGRIHGLLGANGAGKTTLLKVLATLVLPNGGTARVDGHDVTTEATAVRAAIGFVVAEERSFYWRLSGRENLVFFAALRDLHGREGQRRADEVLDVVGLADAATKPYREYSSGMRQRLSIARGLLSSPRVLLMDEPTRALDPPSASLIRTFVRERLARDSRTTVLIATHDLLEAETTCDRLSLVSNGRIVAEGTPAELKRPLAGAARTKVTLLPPHDRVRATFPADVELIDGTEGALDVVMPGNPDEVAERIATMVSAGARIASVTPQDADLAALFRRLARSGDPQGDVA